MMTLQIDPNRVIVNSEGYVFVMSPEMSVPPDGYRLIKEGELVNLFTGRVTPGMAQIPYLGVLNVDTGVLEKPTKGE